MQLRAEERDQIVRPGRPRLKEASFRWRSESCSLCVGIQDDTARDRLPTRGITDEETIPGKNERRLRETESCDRRFPREQLTAIEQ